MSTNNESWGTRVGLILAMAGNAVGFGNFLRFPVQAVQNGGGAFIIPYLVCFLLMGIPLLWIEWSMGRFGGRFGHHSTPFILDSMDKRRFWKYFGVFGIWTNIAVASYYCYLESWTLSYVYHSLIGSFSDLSQIGVADFFTKYVSLDTSVSGIPFEPIVFFVACLILNTWILSKGLSGGVEKVAKIGMPLLIMFGIFLAFKGFTLEAGENGAIFGSSEGLNFLWTPSYDSLWSPKVWLAAAGQIFFTLSVGMGSIQCYASYLKPKDDIALSAMAAGWTNEFVEVVLGAAIIIPISVGYLGVDKVIELTQTGGLGLGFRTLPFLFYQWGDFLGALAGFMWFGLLFFAGITSSLAMGTPWMGFLMDEFKWKRQHAAWSFGFIILILGMPTVLFFNYGVFDEYDYWAGTVSLVVFAMVEAILFAWVFGMEKGWKEIHQGADIRVPGIYRFVIKYITPAFILLVFLSSLVTPKNGDWDRALGGDWQLDDSSIIRKISNSGLHEQLAAATDPAVITNLQDTLLYVNASRALLVMVFAGISLLVYIAYRRRLKTGRA
ncbi:MAG TPA: sodium-dependent transporter [Adhaeribacter sp.]|nr:sodium-dependent transporter [Adhaeribacter sp.]